MLIFGSELIPTGKFVAHHPDEEMITTSLGDTPEHALELAYEEDGDWEFENGDDIAISKACHWMPKFNDGDSIVEDLQQAAYSECGEAAEDFLGHVKPNHVMDLEQRIQTAIREWIKSVYPDDSQFWMCSDTVTQKVVLPPDVVAMRKPDQPLPPIPIYTP